MKIKIYIFHILILINNRIKILKNILEKSMYYFLNSNHPSRLEFLKKKKKIQIIKKSNQLFLYFGDSHVEYYSRYLENNKLNTKAFWIGPQTVLGTIAKNNWEYFQSNLSKYLKSKNLKYIFFSIGSIDVRASFYELKLRKLIDKEQNLYDLFEESLNNLILNIKKITDAQKTKVKIGFFEILYNSEVGCLPKNIYQLNLIRNNTPYPVFGSKKIRTKWLNIANKILKKQCAKNKIKFLETNKFIKNKFSKKYTPDGIHLTEEKTIIKINNNIRIKFNNE